QRQVAESLGGISDAAAGTALVSAYAKMSAPGQEAAFGQVLKRAEWATAFVNAVKAGEIDWRALGPGPAYRLRTHADKSVAKLASQVFDELRGPEAKEKDTLIAQFSQEAEKPGDQANGKRLFDANCSGCHKFKDA